jgi:hypothetical protein
MNDIPISRGDRPAVGRRVTATGGAAAGPCGRLAGMSAGTAWASFGPGGVPGKPRSRTSGEALTGIDAAWPDWPKLKDGPQ